MKVSDKTNQCVRYLARTLQSIVHLILL